MYVSDDRQGLIKVVPLNSSAALEVNTPSGKPKVSGEARTSKELAEIYAVSDRSIQTWYKTVQRAYCWLDESELKTGSSNRTKYTPKCQELMQAFRDSQMGSDEWVNSVHSKHTESISHAKPSPERALEQFGLQPIETEVVQEEGEIGGKLQVTSTVYTAQPLIQITLPNLTITMPSADTSALDGQTAMLASQTNKAFSILGQFVTADLQAKIGTILAQNTNMAAAIQQQAVVTTVENLGVGKPESYEESSLQSSGC